MRLYSWGENVKVSAKMHNIAENPRLRTAAGMGFFWLSAFYFVYCIRPEDWIRPLSLIPLAKITGVAAFLALLFGAAKGKRKLRDLPAESFYLLAMIAILMVSSLVSPVWKGGAISRTLDFAKVYIVWVLTFLLVTDLPKFRKIVYIQAAAVPVICFISIIKGRNTPRLDGVLGGIYSNPNDLAFAIVLSLPFCFMFLLSTRSPLKKLIWALGMLAMAKALFMTASRGGFITLVVAGAVCLWHFGVKGKRLYLIAITGLVALILFATAGATLKERFASLWSDDVEDQQQRAAQESYKQRRYLMEKAVEGIMRYPVLGMGTRNFEVYSEVWREVHMTYMQIAAEGGITSLILFLLFFARGFKNLRILRKRKDLPEDVRLFTGALHSSLVGFVVGACFSPEAYQFFPFFAVAYTSALLAYVRERDRAAALQPQSARAPVPGALKAGRVPLTT